MDEPPAGRPRRARRNRPMCRGRSWRSTACWEYALHGSPRCSGANGPLPPQPDRRRRIRLPFSVRFSSPAVLLQPLECTFVRGFAGAARRGRTPRPCGVRRGGGGPRRGARRSAPGSPPMRACAREERLALAIGLLAGPALVRRGAEPPRHVGFLLLVVRAPAAARVALTCRPGRQSPAHSAEGDAAGVGARPPPGRASPSFMRTPESIPRREDNGEEPRRISATRSENAGPRAPATSGAPTAPRMTTRITSHIPATRAAATSFDRATKSSRRNGTKKIAATTAALIATRIAGPRLPRRLDGPPRLERLAHVGVALAAAGELRLEDDRRSADRARTDEEAAEACLPLDDERHAGACDGGCRGGSRRGCPRRSLRDDETVELAARADVPQAGAGADVGDEHGDAGPLARVGAQPRRWRRRMASARGADGGTDDRAPSAHAGPPPRRPGGSADRRLRVHVVPDPLDDGGL